MQSRDCRHAPLRMYVLYLRRSDSPPVATAVEAAGSRPLRPLASSEHVAVDMRYIQYVKHAQGIIAALDQSLVSSKPLTTSRASG